MRSSKTFLIEPFGVFISLRKKKTAVQRTLYKIKLKIDCDLSYNF